MIRVQSPMPTDTQPSGQTGISVVFREVSHRTLGQAAAQGLVKSERFTAANGTSFLCFSLITFPPNVISPVKI